MGVTQTGMTDVDLDRATMADFFVAIVDDFLLFDGAADGPSKSALSIVFVEPLGLARPLGCACCFAF
jgi:hypothetical protein